MIYKGKGEYQGYWENGRRHGEGVMSYTNGDSYSGWWRFGEKEGTGNYLFKETGMKMFGNWVKGQCLDGNWVYPNGNLYTGAFANNKPIGDGVWHLKSGNTVRGTYEQRPKGEDEEEEAPPEEEEEEGAPKKSKFDLIWHS